MARASEWAERVKEWRRSGLSSAQYAERHELSGRSLLWWSSHFRRNGFATVSDGGRVRLARVVRRSAPAVTCVASSAVVIELHDARVVVGAGAEPATVTMAIAALRASASQERSR